MNDQAAGLRRWAQARQASGEATAEEAPASVQDVAEQAVSEPIVEAAAESPRESRGEPAAAGPERPPEPERSPAIPLMVLGLPATGGVERAQAALASWARLGQRWIGDPAAWQVVACEAESPRLAGLARQQPRWALWVDTEGDGFRQAFRVLRAVRRGGGPRRLLALHPPVASRRGLLDNLQQMARQAFDIELLVLAP